MLFDSRKTRGLVLAGPIACLALFASACNGGGGGASARAADSVTSVTSRDDSSAKGNDGSGLTGESCLSSDPDKLCLAVHFVAYRDSAGNSTATPEQAAAIINGTNRFWSVCKIGFQIEKYEAVDPAQYNLAFGAESQSQTDLIRRTFEEPRDQLLAVTTGPWGTAVNAWTSMPGETASGAIMEAGIVSYGDGVIYAHEFGHYLGLGHEADSANLMSAVVATSSTMLSEAQCASARETVESYWVAMLRRS
ncbi:MAG: hypothetical protein NDJ90_09365 [Oligoflexia bacterium]|nr:hypothetical protein [Oligoflexia bacterium]